MRSAAVVAGYILVPVVLLAVGVVPAHADKCNAAKIKAIGKKEAGLLGCSAKEATKSGIEPACDSKVSGKFTPAYDKPTGCSPAAPADTTCETAADTECQTAIRAALPDGTGTTPNKCEASRLKAAGKLASGELGCISKAAAKGIPVDSGCLSKATGKFTTAFNKVSGCTGDGNASGIQTNIENTCVNNMVDVTGGNFVAITCGGAATSTTTTSSTTTTTITMTGSTTTSTTQTSTTTTTVPLAIVTLSGCALSGYTAPLTIGTQTFDLIADSGSTTLGVASTACPTCIGVSPLYSPGGTAIDQGTTASTTYGDGSAWMGEVFSDLVSASEPATTVRMAFVAITNNQSFFVPVSCQFGGVNLPYQGIVGLGGPALLDAGTDSYLDKLALLGTFADVFSVRLCALGGTLWLGGYDGSAAVAPPSYTPMVGGSSLDEVTLSAVGVAGNTVTLDADAIVDTGSTAMDLPTAAFNAIATTVGAEPVFMQNFSGGASWFTSSSCAIPAQGLTKAQLDSGLPMLELTFPSSPSTTFTVDLPATDSYLLEETDSGGHAYYCPGIFDGGGPPTIIGANAMHSLLTVFDRQNQRIGFAPGQGCPVSGNVALQSRATPPPQTIPAPPYRRHVD